MNCKNCNKPLEEGALFCIECGTKVDSNINETVSTENVVSEPIVQEQVNIPQVSQNIPTQNKKSNTPIIIIIVVSALLLLIGLIVILFLFVVPSFRTEPTANYYNNNN